MIPLAEIERALWAAIKDVDNDPDVLLHLARLEWRLADQLDNGASHTTQASVLAEINTLASQEAANSGPRTDEARTNS